MDRGGRFLALGVVLLGLTLFVQTVSLLQTKKALRNCHERQIATSKEHIHVYRGVTQVLSECSEAIERSNRALERCMGQEVGGE